jgi:hypothetical protein
MLPIIKLTVDHMRQEILHAFSTQQQQYEEALANGLDLAVKNFNFEAEVAIVATNQLQAMCDTIVKEVVQDLRFDIEFQIMCRQRMIDRMVEYQAADQQRRAERKKQ